MKDNEVEEVVVGRVVKTFGLGGELVISLYDTFEYIKEEPVYVSIDNIWTPLFFKYLNRRGKSKAVVVFDDLETEFRASELLGKELVAILEVEIPDKSDDDELYMEELIGYKVIINDGAYAGKVTDFIDSEFNPLFQIDINGEETLVPAADDFIVSINEITKTLTLSIPEGLITLNE